MNAHYIFNRLRAKVWLQSIMRSRRNYDLVTQVGKSPWIAESNSARAFHAHLFGMQSIVPQESPLVRKVLSCAEPGGPCG